MSPGTAAICLSRSEDVHDGGPDSSVDLSTTTIERGGATDLAAENQRDRESTFVWRLRRDRDFVIDPVP